ncbi:MAG: thioredoxin domain-containing protein, partial [Phycisphaerae bacterium]|nr:thioredoxin domain-containing protein [Phycisphaerae bacterium]
MGTKDGHRPNRLAQATSPYLLQHAHNPVDWHEWGEDAFERAKRENKPILLSIGYAACHWCHVMAHESFEDDAVAAMLNQHFVCIKVDREERPDVDEIYMQATLALNNGQGGWPMTLFLTPDRTPFFAGTYFPPDAFKRLVKVIADAWQNRPGELIEQSGKVQQYLQTWAAVPPAGEQGPGAEEVVTTARELVRYF